MYRSLAFPESRVWDKGLLVGGLFLNGTSGIRSPRQGKWNGGGGEAIEEVLLNRQLVCDPIETFQRFSWIWMWLRSSIQELKEGSIYQWPLPASGFMHTMHFQVKHMEGQIHFLQHQKGLKAEKWEILGTRLKCSTVLNYPVATL